MIKPYRFETFGYFPARLYQLGQDTGLGPLELYKELDAILADPTIGDAVTPFYSDIRVRTLGVRDLERHILYAIEEKQKAIILIDAAEYDLRSERRKLLYSLAALYELRKVRSLLFRLATGGLV